MVRRKITHIHTISSINRFPRYPFVHGRHGPRMMFSSAFHLILLSLRHKKRNWRYANTHIIIASTSNERFVSLSSNKNHGFPSFYIDWPTRGFFGTSQNVPVWRRLCVGSSFGMFQGFGYFRCVPIWTSRLLQAIEFVHLCLHFGTNGNGRRIGRSSLHTHFDKRRRGIL